MKNEFRKEYEHYQKIKRAFEEAEKAESTEGMEQARETYRTWAAAIEGKGKNYGRLYKLHEEAWERGNEHIDLNDCIWEKDVKGMIDSFREFGIKAFTFSSGWSGANEIAWLFLQNGCSLEGLVEINSPHKEFMSEEYEKAHGYLFRVN